MSHEPCAMGDVPFLTYLFFVLGLQSALHGHGSKDSPRMGTSPSHQKSIYLDKWYPLDLFGSIWIYWDWGNYPKIFQVSVHSSSSASDFSDRNLRDATNDSTRPLGSLWRSTMASWRWISRSTRRSRRSLVMVTMVTMVTVVNLWILV